MTPIGLQVFGDKKDTIRMSRTQAWDFLCGTVGDPGKGIDGIVWRSCYTSNSIPPAPAKVTFGSSNGSPHIWTSTDCNQATGQCTRESIAFAGPPREGSAK